ncbi:discoidin domain-containing protein [Pectobacterium carotovorum]|uniref:discoidin domain-containing protein n=2 Tax=Pectobacterium carotovorum TaxID=554 RepID=UPI0010FEDE78|nr:discoidin domain-containing protein [Pectobacterium carotovorum]KAA3666850.1 discoidin domain-containing protein [Pectobacterium carotovorum subsp. carotovorum]UCZ80648.1 discoidin domain-containing protein [Pectobacterium carotovorum]
MKDINIEINVCDSTGKSTCTVHPHTCCHSDNGGGQEPGISGVASVFGRTGVVTAQAGDYTADQITETATRKFASPDEKAIWNAKQDALISGTTIRTLFGQSLLGSGDFSPTPAQMGVAAADHTHTTADITDYTQKTKQLIHSSLEAGAGVTLSYNAVSEKTIISAVGDGSGGGSGYIVAERLGATAGQNHAFSIRPQNTFNLAAYALKEEAGAANQTYVVDDFNASSEPNYNATNAVIFDGTMHPDIGGSVELVKDGEFYSSEIKTGNRAVSISIPSGSIVPAMTADSDRGYVASASSIYSPSYPAYIAFDRNDSSPNNVRDCWASNQRPTNSNPQWLCLTFPSHQFITEYAITNRVYAGLSNPRSWQLQGSNNDNDWITLHTVSNDENNTSGAVRRFTVSTPGRYMSYRLLFTASNGGDNFVCIKELSLFTGSKMLLKDGEQWFTVTNGVLSNVPVPSSASDFIRDGFTASGNIQQYPSGNIYSGEGIHVDVRYTPQSQISIQRARLSAGSWSQINAATLTATQTGNGKVRVAVTRDLVNWHVLRNGVWVDVGALSADIIGAEALIADGMTPTELGGITAAQWTQLFSSNNGVPDSLAFAFALDITDPVTDVATIDRLVLNVNDASSWKVQSPAEVEIRWRTDSVTFRTVTAGNYKLAYQIP